MGMHNELWFPTVIWSSLVHSVQLGSLKTLAYARKNNQSNQSVLNEGGFTSTQLELGENYELDKLMDMVNSEIDNCRKQVGIGRLALQDMWININPPNSHVKPRVHPYSCFTGVFIIDAAKRGGNIQFERTDRGEYHIPSRIEENNYYNATHAQYAARSGALYVWPGWLRYNQSLNQGNTDQITLGFTYGEKA